MVVQVLDLWRCMGSSSWLERVSSFGTAENCECSGMLSGNWASRHRARGIEGVN